ncbi:MAG TPA: VCBS repeat-containing protein, partial [Acidobacteria bacterium]|nr:VCBS repeat-containing protein [Acidobacteriota bacterium]
MGPVGSTLARPILATLAAAIPVAGGACATGSGSRGPGASPGSGGYTRIVAPFPVLDEAGNPIEHPFLGGFNIPRPQLIDIDGDGDDDLFVQEETGRIMFFENVPGETPQFQWRTDRFQDLEVGEWFRFVDLDQDGDADLLAEQPFSYVRYYR